MRCDQALERIGDFVDGDFGRIERWWLRLHLLMCRNCRRYLASYRKTIRAEKCAFRNLEASSAVHQISDDQAATILDVLKRKDWRH